MKDIIGEYCRHHRRLDLGYFQWHTIAAKRVHQKYTQIFCEKCRRYLFPDELNEPDNPASIRIVAEHEKYLKQHRRAKPITKL